MKTSQGYDGMKQENHIIWELDGGNYGSNDIAELFEGRLYTTPMSLRIAKLRSHTRRTTRVMAAIVPFFLVFSK